MKNNKFIIMGLLAVLLAFGLVLAGCNNGNDEPNAFAVTNITDAMLSEATDICLIGMFPESATQANVVADANAFGSGSATSYVVAYALDPTPTGSSGNWTISGSLLSVSSGTPWRGDGTYNFWTVLGNGTEYKLYKSNTAKTLTPGGSLSLHAVNDFTLSGTEGY